MDSKKMDVYSQPLMIVAGFVIGQLPLLSYKKLDLYVATMSWLAILYVNVRSYVDLGSPLLRVSLVNLLPAKTKNVRIYIEAAIVVVISYVLLLRISWSFIWLLLFPIITIGFIVALCKELSHEDEAGGSHSQERSNEGEGEATASSGEKAEGLKAVALVPYWLLCIMGHFHPDKFAVSQFLLFFSFMLGALTLMMTRLVRAGLPLATAHRGIVPASELLWKASLVVLLVALHAVAAELLGENALLLCMPEILPVLLWLSVRLDLDFDDRAVITITAADRIKLVLDSTLLRAAPAAVLAVLAAVYKDESLLYWCGKALVSCTISVLLTFYVVFMLCQWPGGQRDGAITADILQQAVNLLKSWANFLLASVAALLTFVSVVSFQLVLLQEPVVSSSADQILHRLCQKIIQFII